MPRIFCCAWLLTIVGCDDDEQSVAARCPADGGSVNVADLGVEAPATIAARATTRVLDVVNLDLRAALPVSAWDVQNPAKTSNFPSSLTVYDSRGQGHQVTIYFTRSGAITWDWHAVADGSEIEAGTSGVPFEGASGTLTFNTSDLLQSEQSNGSSWNFKAASTGQGITFDFGKSIDEGGTGTDATTSFANAFVTNKTEQDGYAEGSLKTTVAIGNNVVGTYSNGETKVLGACP